MAWVLFSLLTVSVLAMLAVPVFRRSAMDKDAGDAEHDTYKYDPRREHDLAVYRYQLAEVDKDAERGVLNAEEAAAAKLEVERRMLRAADDKGERRATVANSWRFATMIGLAAVLAAGAFGVYSTLGRPDLPDRPLAQRGEERQRAVAESERGQEMTELAARLAAKMEQSPDDIRGWVLLGRTYGTLGRTDDAAKAFRRAIALNGQDPELHIYLAETLITGSGNAVTPEAAKALKAALDLNPKHPAARFYLALARAQADDWKGAYERWLALAADTPADAPWREGLVRQLETAAAQIGADLDADMPEPAPPMARAEEPGPSREDMEAAASMTPEQRAEMIQGMIRNLAERLEAQPDDFDGWMRLGRAYLVTRAHAKAQDAYRKAVGLQPENVGALMNLAGAIIDGNTGNALPEEAVGLLRKVNSLDPRNPDALWFIGRAELEAGRPGGAKEAWTKLLALLDPASPEHANVKASIEQIGQ